MRAEKAALTGPRLFFSVGRLIDLSGLVRLLSLVHLFLAIHPFLHHLVLLAPFATASSSASFLPCWPVFVQFEGDVFSPLFVPLFAAASLATRFVSFVAPVVWPVFEGETVSFPDPVPCETTTQFPKPEVVMNDARQSVWLVPPVHLIPAGSWTLSCSVPAAVGF